MEPVNVQSMVRREMSRARISMADLSRQLHVSPSTVLGMFNRSTMQVQKLVELSAIFNYNFFREIANTLPYAGPAAEASEKDALNERIKALEMEVGILRQTLKDVVSGK